MDYELALNKANRLKLSRVFYGHKRVDLSIDCVIEGQMGKAFVDDPVKSTAYRITVGSFWYFAGDARSSGGYEMMKEFPAYNLLMPSPAEWLAVAQEVYGQNLQPFTRYSFSAANLSAEHLAHCLKASTYGSRVIPINPETAKRLAELPDSYFDLSDFDSAEDFAERGFGFMILDEGTPMGVAYSSLVCSKGIEVSVFVEEQYRRKGVATALASRLLLECLQLNLRPNWDAANPESCKLAKKLGYFFAETYDAYYHTLR